MNRTRNGVFCVATMEIDGIVPCVNREDHLTTCADPTCGGCGLRLADEGHLCYPHWKRVDNALTFWPTWVKGVNALGGAPAVSPTKMHVDSSRTDFDPTNRAEAMRREAEKFFPAEEVDTGWDWVQTEDGARQAIQFALYAGRAFAAVEVIERQSTVSNIECPWCLQSSTLRIPPTWEGGELTFVCQTEGCGRVIDQDQYDRMSERDLFQFACARCDWIGGEHASRDDAREERNAHVLHVHDQARTA